MFSDMLLFDSTARPPTVAPVPAASVPGVAGKRTHPHTSWKAQPHNTLPAAGSSSAAAAVWALQRGEMGIFLMPRWTPQW